MKSRKPNLSTAFIHLDNNFSPFHQISTSIGPNIIMSQDRNLRILTLGTTALATPLLIGCTVLSFKTYSWYRPTVTTFCFGYIPLAFTAAASVIGITRHGRIPRFSIALLDLVAAVTYMALLIPIWAVEVPRLNQGGVGLLIGYSTAPMIINM
jgi:hypothetical protein